MPGAIPTFCRPSIWVLANHYPTLWQIVYLPEHQRYAAWPAECELTDAMVRVSDQTWIMDWARDFVNRLNQE